MPEFAPFQLDDERKPGSLRYWSKTNQQRTLPPPSASSILQHTGVSGTPVVWLPISATGIDHGGLSGLTDDDHTQYALLAGRSGGQTLIGGTASGNKLTLQANSANGSDSEVEVVSTATGATGAQLALYQDSSSPAANDVAGIITGYAKDAGGTKTAITAWNGIATGVSAGAMTSAQAFRTLSSGGTARDIYMDPGWMFGPGDDDFWHLGQSGQRWTKLWVKDIDYSGTITAQTREIPMWISSTATSGGVPFIADETATSIIVCFIKVPSTWDGSTNITLKTIWFCDNTGLKDIETQITYSVETDETAITTVQAFTNTNLTWSAANVTKTLTTTLSSLAAGRYYRVSFRCNTGDANTGNLFLQGAAATTAVR